MARRRLGGPGASRWCRRKRCSPLSPPRSRCGTRERVHGRRGGRGGRDRGVVRRRGRGLDRQGAAARPGVGAEPPPVAPAPAGPTWVGRRAAPRAARRRGADPRRTGARRGRRRAGLRRGVDAGAPRSWALADVLDLAFTDPARPAAVQILVEQHGPADGAVDPRFGPARTYGPCPSAACRCGRGSCSRSATSRSGPRRPSRPAAAGRPGPATRWRRWPRGRRPRRPGAGSGCGRWVRPRSSGCCVELGDPAPGGVVSRTSLTTASAAARVR